MMRRSVKLAAVLAVLALLLIACTGESIIPPCTPAEGSDVDPCEPGTARISVGFVMGPDWENGPRSLKSRIEGSDTSAAHLVVRGTFLPETVRCNADRVFRSPPYVGGNPNARMLRCFSDIRVNEYIVGTGPTTLTVVVYSVYHTRANLPMTPELAADIEQLRLSTEQGLIWGRQGGQMEVSPGGIGGREKIMFVGLELDYALEAFKVRRMWDVVRADDGTVMVHHPYRDYWLGEDAAKYRSKVEWTLADFKTAAVAAHNARNEKYGGRVRSGTQYPRIIADASNLHQAYVDTGAINHPDGPPARELPPACGKAIPDQAENPELRGACMALLGLKDALRGTGTLNWSVDVAIADWEGVIVTGTRLTGLELNGKNLNGTIPPELSKLRGLIHLMLQSNQLTGAIPASLEWLWWMETLKLAGNSLTGCIPAGLRDVPQHDLDRLGLPDCAPP